MHSIISLTTEINRRRKFIEDREIFIDVMEHDGFDMTVENDALGRERDLLARDIAELQALQRGDACK